MKAVLICGTAANQRALANRLHAVHPLSAIAAISLPKRRRNWRRTVVSAIGAKPLGRSWRQLMRHYDAKFPEFPIPPTIHPSTNAPEIQEIIRGHAPDLVLVSGTDLIKPAQIEAIPARIMNLHTGISPYLKGGPNCTNWALANGEFSLIGNSILWLDPGIDAGPIVATERTPLTGRESLFELHLKVMDHAHDLFGRAYQRFILGAPLPSVAQSRIGDGRLFLGRQWTLRRMLSALANFYLRFSPEGLDQGPRPNLVSLVPGARE